MDTFTALAYEQQIELYKQASTIALRTYDLETDSIYVEPLSFVNNATFKVQALYTKDIGQKFALRIHRPDKVQIDMVLSELQWLQAIQRDTSLRTPHPLLTKDEEYLVSISLPCLPQPFYCVLFEWLEGCYLRTSEQTPELAYQIGQFIGVLHQHACQFSSASGLVRRRLDSGYLVEQCMFIASAGRRQLFTPEHLRLFRVVEKQARTVFNELDQEPQSFGLIHADLIWKNYFFHKTGVGAVDFDSCSWGYFLYDLAPTLLGYRDESNYPALRHGLLSGYRRVRPLLPQHEQYLDTLIAVRHLISCAWLARHLDNPTLLQQAPMIIAHRTSEICKLMKLPNFT